MDPELIKSIYESAPSVKFCNRFNGISPLWDYSPHKHPYFEMLYHINGDGYRKLSDITQDFTLFDTIIYPVNCWHEDGSPPDENNEVYCIWVDIPNITLSHPVKIQDREGQFEKLFREIYKESQRPNPCPQVLSLLIKTLLIQILRFEEESKTAIIDKIIQYLNLHFNEPVSLDSLTQMVHVSKSFLTKHFKRKTGLTIVQYVHNERIQLAQRLLITTDKSIEEIAFEIGFDSPKYFFKIFKAKENISPYQYRKNHIEKSLKN